MALVFKFLFTIIVEFFRYCNYIIKCLNRINLTKKFSFSFIKLNRKERTNLVIKIDAINQQKLTDVLAFRFEEIAADKILIAFRKLALESRISILNQPFNPSIFDHIQETLKPFTVISKITIFFWSVQRMTDLMTNQ